MDAAKVAEKLGIAKELKRLPTLREGENLWFAFSPEEAVPVLIVRHREELNLGRLPPILSRKLGDDVLGGLRLSPVVIGRVVPSDEDPKRPRFVIDPKASKGAFTVAEVRRALRAHKDTKGCILLAKAEVSLPSGDDARDTRTLKGKAEKPVSISWRGKLRDLVKPGKGLATQINDAYTALSKARSADEVRAHAGELVVLAGAWLEGDKGAEGDRPERQERRDQIEKLLRKVGRDLLDQLADRGAFPSDEESQILARVDLYAKDSGKKDRHDEVGLTRHLDDVRDEQALQTDLSDGTVTTRSTAEDGSGGQSASYKLRRGDRLVAVFKPAQQEAEAPDDTYQVGDCTRNEILASELGDVLSDTAGLELGLNRAQLVTLESDAHTAFGANATVEYRNTHPGVDSPLQTGALLAAPEGITGSAKAFAVYRFRTPLGTIEVPMELLQPAKTQQDEAERLMALAKHAEAQYRALDPIAWDQLDPADRKEHVESTYPYFTADRDYLEVVRLPEGVTGADLAPDLARTALADLFLVNVDHGNRDNLLVVEGEDGVGLQPIDFGNALPGVYAAQQKFAKDPGFAGGAFEAWAGMPGADIPLTPDVVRALGQVDPGEVVATTRERARRLAERSGGKLPPLHPEASLVQHLSIASAQRAVAAGLRTPERLASVYQSSRPKNGTLRQSPFGAALDALDALRDKPRRGKLPDDVDLDGLLDTHFQPVLVTLVQAWSTLDAADETLRRDVAAVAGARAWVRRLQDETADLRSGASTRSVDLDPVPAGLDAALARRAGRPTVALAASLVGPTRRGARTLAEQDFDADVEALRWEAADFVSRLDEALETAKDGRAERLTRLRDVVIGVADQVA